MEEERSPSPTSRVRGQVATPAAAEQDSHSFSDTRAAHDDAMQGTDRFPDKQGVHPRPDIVGSFSTPPTIQPSATDRVTNGRARPAAPPSNPAAAAAGPAAKPTVAGSTETAPTACSLALNASRIQDMQPENVLECDARMILEGLQLSQRELGRGSFGIVVAGTYRGLPCAVKLMVANHLDRSAVRELLLGPSLSHPNVVQTFTSRCARLTHGFFDMLEGADHVGGDPSSQPRMLQPISLVSGDGFGDPSDVTEGGGVDPYRRLRDILIHFRAVTSQMVVVVVQEVCTKTSLAHAIRLGIFRPNAQQWGVRLARRALLRTAGDVARGLLHLHDAGVIHGDVKPANVLLGSSRNDRRGFTAKVADFGLAHVLPAAATSMSTDSFGSPAYMSPEAFTGSISRAVDVWSFGVTLWEMLMGRRPFENEDSAVVVAGIKQGTLSLQWPDDNNNEDDDSAAMSADICALGRSCLHHNPEDRPGFAAILQELVNIERGIRADFLAPQVAERGAAQQAQQALAAQQAQQALAAQQAQQALAAQQAQQALAAQQTQQQRLHLLRAGRLRSIIVIEA